MPIDFQTTFATLKPVIIFIISITIYSIFIFHFYKFLAKKDIFELNLSKYNRTSHWFLKPVFATMFYLFEFLFIMPVFIFFWFSILCILLSFLAKNQTIDNILLVSIAVVGTIRICAYYNEDLSRDLAKMLPFALLGVFLIDISYFSIDNSITLILSITEYGNEVIYYLGFIFFLEFMLRILYLAIFPFTRKKKELSSTQEIVEKI